MFSVLDFTILPLLLAKVVEVFNFMTLMKIKIDNITINGINCIVENCTTKGPNVRYVKSEEEFLNLYKDEK